MIDIKHLQDRLKYDTIEITFTKLNGEQRVMNCTQNLAYIPEDKHPIKKEIDESAPVQPETESTAIRAFDLDKGEWRSFRKDSVISYQVEFFEVS